MNDLKQKIENKNVILFAGAGVSAALELPTWGKLIEKFSEDLGYHSEIFKGFGDSLALAEYYEIEKNGIEELSKWMKKEWDIPIEKIQNSKIHENISKLEFPIIYTTNYDHCLETALSNFGKKYKKIVTVAELVNIKHDENQLVKFHGDMDLDKTIVLTEKSYFERLSFESPLDIKLRSDMLGKSILFIGYSLTDINIRLLIYKLDKIWKDSEEEVRPKLYLFLPNPNPVQAKILEQRGIETIIGKSLDPKESLEKFLEELL